MVQLNHSDALGVHTRMSGDCVGERAFAFSQPDRQAHKLITGRVHYKKPVFFERSSTIKYAGQIIRWKQQSM